MRYLNEEEIEILSRKYSRNPEKQEFFKKYYNKMIIKNMDFDEYWERAMKIARKEQFFGKYIEEYRDLTKETIHILREKIFYEENLFDIAEEISGYNLHKQDKILEHEKRVYVIRTKSFFDKYGNDEFEYNLENNYDTTNYVMKDYLNLYLKGKISREELNNIIKSFEESNPAYPNSSFYKSKYNNNGSERDFH